MPCKIARTRLDELVAKLSGITRSAARSLILEGRVSVEGAQVTKAGASVKPHAKIAIERPRRFVSRGGEKLEHALSAFEVDVAGARVLDVGASTGGFTDCLLQRGAASVVAVDVGYGQFDWRLRNDPRVTILERTNFRHLPGGLFKEPFQLVVIDVSFISLKTIVERAIAELAPGGTIVALVKPQFEAGRKRLGRGGVVRDPEVHRAVLREVRDAMQSLGLTAAAVTPSPLLGPAGNREFFMLARREGAPVSDTRLDEAIARGASS